jgi:hypothetical protein
MAIPSFEPHRALLGQFAIDITTWFTWSIERIIPNGFNIVFERYSLLTRLKYLLSNAFRLIVHVWPTSNLAATEM